MNDYADTDIHFSTSWVIEQISLHAAARHAECAFLPDIVRAISEKHRKACFDAFTLASLMGEIELSANPLGKIGYRENSELPHPREVFEIMGDSLKNGKGLYLIWARVQQQQQTAQRK